jgi:D-glycero-D-manno-heptose 1,7-bisphosphate phosphatase
MRLLILDRDGVINYDSDDYIKSPEEWQPIPGSLSAIARLKQAGFTIAIASNQSGIARGYYTIATLNAIHQKMQQALQVYDARIDAIFYCPHGPNDHCNCRKPKPGLLLQIADHFQTPLTGVPFIGDSLRDLQAAQAVGCQPIFVQTGKPIEDETLLQNIPCYTNLAAASDALIYG